MVGLFLHSERRDRRENALRVTLRFEHGLIVDFLLGALLACIAAAR